MGQGSGEGVMDRGLSQEVGGGERRVSADGGRGRRPPSHTSQSWCKQETELVLVVERER